VLLNTNFTQIDFWSLEIWIEFNAQSQFYYIPRRNSF
jgi:hypothetical protein